jgi:hypothetical protein
MVKSCARIVLLLTAAVTITLTGCGGGGANDVVAKVGNDPITRVSLQHWMSTLAGGDYYELSRKHTLPAGLISGQPNYARCVGSLEAIVAALPASRQHPTAPQLLIKCRELYQALKGQALDFLVNAVWTIDLYREMGVTATDAEVTQLRDRIEREQFVTPAAFRSYLADRRWSMTDYFLMVRMNLLNQKMQKKLAASGKKGYLKLTEAAQRWTAKTDCQSGYVVTHCKQFTGQQQTSGPSAAVLMEQIAAVTGVHCVNRPACAKQ